MNISFRNILILGITFRILIFIILSILPYFHEIFGQISPLSFHIFADYGLYKNFGEGPKGLGDIFSFDQFINTYKNIIFGNFELVQIRYPGIFFTLLIYLTNYSANFTYAMSILTFFAEISAYVLWCSYFYKKYDYLSALIFSFLPIPLVFGFFHSSDTYFYLFSTLIFLCLKDYIKIKSNNFLLFLILILMTIRPASIILISFTFIYSFFDNRYNKNFKIIIFLILLFTTFYYSQYFIFETNKIKDQIYLKNIFNFNMESYIYYYLYLVINFFYKIFLMLGFIKSESGNLYFYSIRASMAVIFITGFVYMYLKKYEIDFYYVNFLIFSVSLFLYPAYRYSLPVTPILYIYAYQLFKYIVLRNKNI